MKIQEQELFYGAALAQIVEHGEAVHIYKRPDQNSVYVINQKSVLMLKYRTNARAPWRFQLSEREEDAIRAELVRGKDFFLGLVCANHTICVLGAEELKKIIDFEVLGDKWISVNSGHNRSLWVAGPAGEMSTSIRHNDFPRKLFTL
ncbi:hypothetical protein [Tumebacillus algifaecis]|uniref:hypothetical protein n=1 Tax=Tumebacillus algifaecis TaxID=1214604 RepID=UPI0012FD49DB|nr:hypothetical protein [Tumebacillus algifaecis]